MNSGKRHHMSISKIYLALRFISYLCTCMSRMRFVLVISIETLLHNNSYIVGNIDYIICNDGYELHRMQVRNVSCPCHASNVNITITMEIITRSLLPSFIFYVYDDFLGISDVLFLNKKLPMWHWPSNMAYRFNNFTGVHASRLFFGAFQVIRHFEAYQLGTNSILYNTMLFSA